MADSPKEPSRLSVYATLTGLALLIAVLHQTGASLWLRRTFEGWGLSPFGVNVAFAVLLGLMFGAVLRAGSLLSHRVGRKGNDPSTERRVQSRR
jgi:hypothetical protein